MATEFSTYVCVDCGITFPMKLVGGHACSGRVTVERCREIAREVYEAMDAESVHRLLEEQRRPKSTVSSGDATRTMETLKSQPAMEAGLKVGVSFDEYVPSCDKTIEALKAERDLALSNYKCAADGREALHKELVSTRTKLSAAEAALDEIASRWPGLIDDILRRTGRLGGEGRAS